MSIGTKIMPLMFGLTTLLPAQAQKPLIETVAKDTVKISHKVSKDVSLRTFQFLNGINLTAVGMGFGINKGKISAYASPLMGHNFKSKQPWIGGMGFINRRYSQFNDKCGLHHELYGETVAERKGPFDFKIAYTPLVFDANLSKKVNLSLDPRLAVHINKDGFNPKWETLITLSGLIKNDISWYAIAQAYDAKMNPDNLSVNLGLVYNF